MAVAAEPVLAVVPLTNASTAITRVRAPLSSFPTCNIISPSLEACSITKYVPPPANYSCPNKNRGECPKQDSQVQLFRDQNARGSIGLGDNELCKNRERGCQQFPVKVEFCYIADIIVKSIKNINVHYCTYASTIEQIAGQKYRQRWFIYFYLTYRFLNECTK